MDIILCEQNCTRRKRKTRKRSTNNYEYRSLYNAQRMCEKIKMPRNSESTKHFFNEPFGHAREVRITKAQCHRHDLHELRMEHSSPER